MSPAPIVRQPLGIPIGGQFADRARTDGGLTLNTGTLDAESYTDALAQALAASAAYEQTDAVTMEDHEFDRLLETIRRYESDNDVEPEHDLYDVGHGGAVGGDVEHATRMMSLDKPGEDAVIDFALAHPDAIVEPKIDGLALSLRYENGVLMTGARRGDGYSGEDVTARLKGVEGLPDKIDSGTFEVRGELYLSDENMVKANEVRAAAGKDPFKNARNGIAGMINKEDGCYDGLYSFAAYSTTIDEDADHTDSMERLEGMGFTTARSLLPQSVRDASDPMAAIAALGAERKGIGFLMDGAVLKVNTSAEREELGERTASPRWATAYKYPPVEEPSVIEDIEYNIGKTGRLSIRARYTPVDVDGSTLEYASLHNVFDLQRKDIRIGDNVSIFKSNDVIPAVHMPLKDLRDPSSQPWQPPAACPKCNGEFDKSTDLWRCTNPECSTSGRISYAVSRDAGFDIDGFGPSIGDALIESDMVKDVSDLFYLKEDELANLVTGKNEKGSELRVGEKTAAKIMAEIEKAKAQPLNRVITSLSMRYTGRTFGRRLASAFPTMDLLRSATVEQLANVEGIGGKKAEGIHAGLKANAAVIDRMAAAGVNMGTPPRERSDGEKAPKLVAADGAPMNVVITGSLKGSALGSLSRTGAQELIEANGGKASGSVSKNTSLLVCGEEGSSKWNKAKELGIKVVTPDEFAQMLEDGEA